MPFSARQVRASLSRNSAVVAGLKGLGCAGCGGDCGKGLGDCSYDDATGQYDICTDSVPVAPTIPGGYGVVQPFDYSTVYVPPPPIAGNATSPSILNALTNAAVARLAVPQLNPGQSITTLPNGTQVLTQQASGYPLGASSGQLGLNASGNSSGMLLLLGGLALVLVMGKKS